MYQNSIDSKAVTKKESLKSLCFLCDPTFLNTVVSKILILVEFAKTGRTVKNEKDKPLIWKFHSFGVLTLDTQCVFQSNQI